MRVAPSDSESPYACCLQTLVGGLSSFGPGVLTKAPPDEAVKI